jgi:glycosyltransferase involved in cell wall biosynthesis
LNLEEKIIMVIPAFNEETTIGNVVSGAQKYVDEIIVVNDGSNDNTGKVARDNGAILLNNPENVGYDKTIDNGFIEAKKRGASIIITFDADGQHHVSDIPSMIEPLKNGTADMVVGKRPNFARITEYLFALITKFKVGIQDPLCGMKSYRIEVYDEVGYFDRKKSIGTELMFNAKKKGFRIAQVPIIINQRKDESRFGRRINANFLIFKAIIKTFF